MKESKNCKRVETKKLEKSFTAEGVEEKIVEDGPKTKNEILFIGGYLWLAVRAGKRRKGNEKEWRKGAIQAHSERE